MHIHRNCLIQISMKFNIIIVMTFILTYIKIWKWSLIWKLSVCSDKNVDRCFVSWSDQACFRINVKTPQMISVRWVFIFSSRKGINFSKKKRRCGWALEYEWRLTICIIVFIVVEWKSYLNIEYSNGSFSPESINLIWSISLNKYQLYHPNENEGEHQLRIS